MILKAMTALDAAKGLADFLLCAGAWAKTLLQCEAASVVLVTLGGADEAVLRVGVPAEGGGGGRVVAYPATGAGRGLTIVAARVGHSRCLNPDVLAAGQVGAAGCGGFVPEVDCLALRRQGGRGWGEDGEPPRVTSIVCSPWPLPGAA